MHSGKLREREREIEREGDIYIYIERERERGGELLELERLERLSAKTAQYFDHRLCFTDAQARTHQSFMEKKVDKALNNRQPTESTIFVKICPFRFLLSFFDPACSFGTSEATRTSGTFLGLSFSFVALTFAVPFHITINMFVLRTYVFTSTRVCVIIAFSPTVVRVPQVKVRLKFCLVMASCR